MISIGGIIGGGVFVGSSGAIATIGPAVVLSYLLAGIVVFAVISCSRAWRWISRAWVRSPSTCA